MAQNKTDLFDKEQVLAYLRDKVSEERYQHTLKVRDFALKLAEGTDVRPDRVEAAALLHDVAKGMSRDEMYRYAASYGIPLAPEHKLNFNTLHQHVGAVMARQDFGVHDASVLAAISKHATGDAHMSKLDIIIYMADKLEEGRDYDGVKDLRGLAMRDLDEAFFQTLRKTIIFVLDRSLYLDEMSVRAYNDACVSRSERMKAK